MANISIVREMTSSELTTDLALSSTLWNNDYYGTQIYVTDKDWLLFCKKNNKCGSLEPLKIMNGDTLPTGVEPEVLLIDTGVVTSDLTEETGSPLNVTLIDGYNPISVEFDNIDLDEIYYIRVFQIFYTEVTLPKYITSPYSGGVSAYSTINYNTVSVGQSEPTAAKRFIISFHRSHL